MRGRLLIAAAMAAAMVPGAGMSVPITARESAPEPRSVPGGGSTRSTSATNGGRRYTTAQARRVSTKRRNRLRAKGHHRQAVR